ncbi:MAG: hypothetical protein EXR75_02790 [Myxococcales bacterium]|nr:hypothetical protein [Myxococcales bacterium]
MAALAIAARARKVARSLRDLYGVADPRTLGLARIVAGLLLAANCIRHWSVARLYYSNEGVLTNHFHLFRPSGDFNFSLFHAFSSLPEVHIAFALALACHLLFAIGYRARLFAVLSSVWVASLDNRLVMVENGGYVVVNLLIFWLCFLPTGQRFSVDSLMRSWRERRETSIAELDPPLSFPWLTEPRVSLAAFALIANLVVIYTLNIVNKYGDTWRIGATAHYVLHLDRMVTGLAVFLRETLPYPATQLATWLVLVTEALILVTIVWPRRRLFARPVAMALMLLLHGGFGVMMRLGPFSWFLIGWSTLLITREHWEALARRHRARTPVTLVFLLETSGLALAIGRVLRRLDTTGSLRFAPLIGTDDLLAARVMSDDAQAAEPLVGRTAIRAIVRALPGGAIFTRALPALMFIPIAALLRVLGRHRAACERFFGLAIPKATLPTLPTLATLPTLPTLVTLPSPAPSRSRVTETAMTWLGRGREVVLGGLLLSSLSQLINENKSIPKVLHHKQPKFVRAILGYPRLFQGWGMFSPNPVRQDGIVAIDGFTIDGRRVDPFTGAAPDLNLADARGLGLGQIEQDYFNRIRLDRNRAYHKPLTEYLAHWHLRTGNPADQLVAFDVYWLEDDCPPPGSLTPANHKTVCLISWRKPGYRPKGDEPRPPAKCKETSAGK